MAKVSMMMVVLRDGAAILGEVKAKSLNEQVLQRRLRPQVSILSLNAEERLRAEAGKANVPYELGQGRPPSVRVDGEPGVEGSQHLTLTSLARVEVVGGEEVG